jgi:hypothetical protein
MHCKYCEKAFTRLDNLKRHEILACNQRPSASEDTKMEEDNDASTTDDDGDDESQLDDHKDTLGDISDYHSINSDDEEEEKMSKKESKAWDGILNDADLLNLVEVNESVSELWRDDTKLIKVVRRLANVIHRLEGTLTHLKDGLIYPNIYKDRMEMRKKGYSYVEATLSAWEKRKFLIAHLLKRKRVLLNDMYFVDKEEEDDEKGEKTEAQDDA